MKKCCIRTCITSLIFVILIAVGVVVFLNLTPTQLHLADTSIGGSTMRDYGLADVKIIKIIKGFRSLSKKEEKVVNNPYNAESEKAAARTLFANSNYAASDEYGQLVVDDAIFDERYLRGANDTTLAYILDNVIGSAYAIESSDGTKTAAMSVCEFTITKPETEGGDKGQVRMVIGVSASSFIGNLSAVSGVGDKVNIKLPDYVYVVCTADFTVGSAGVQSGKIIFENTHANLGGDEDNVIGSFIFGIVNSAIGQEASDPSQNEVVFSNLVFDKTAAVINHIGAIGSTYASDSVVPEGKPITYGMAGVTDGKFFFIMTKQS